MTFLHFHIITFSHYHIRTLSHLHIRTFAHLHICTFAHLHICTSFLIFQKQTSVMIPAIRKAFNEAFSKERYEAFLADLNSKHPGAIEFRVAETPLFVPKNFADKLIDACE